MSESDASRRLACFDRESARLVEPSAPIARQANPPAAAPASTAPAAAAPASAPATVAATSTPAPSAQDKFGYRGNIARAELDKKEAEEKGDSEQLTARVTEIATLPRGEMRLTLDNGQIWQQKPGERGLRLRVGDEVTIKRASLRSFLLSASGIKGAMRVSRVQ